MRPPHFLWLALLVVLTGLVAASGPMGLPSEAAQATPQPQTTAARGAVRAGQSPTVLGDINNDGIVDIRDYGIWRQQFGATDCGNAADLNGDCIVDIRDYGIWRQNFGQTGPTLVPTPPVRRAYVVNDSSNNVTVIDTTTNTVVGGPITVGTSPIGVGIGP